MCRRAHPHCCRSNDRSSDTFKKIISNLTKKIINIHLSIYKKRKIESLLILSSVYAILLVFLSSAGLLNPGHDDLCSLDDFFFLSLRYISLPKLVRYLNTVLHFAHLTLFLTFLLATDFARFSL